MLTKYQADHFHCETKLNLKRNFQNFAFISYLVGLRPRNTCLDPLSGCVCAMRNQLWIINKLAGSLSHVTDRYIVDHNAPVNMWKMFL